MIPKDSRDYQAALRMVAGRDLPWLLRMQAQNHKDKNFLIWAPFEGEHETWTYKEFETAVRRVASGLSKKGVTQGSRVLIHLDNCPELLLSWFACAYIGAVGVLSNTRSIGRDMAYFAEHTEAVGAITQPAYAAMVSEATPQLHFLAITESDAGEQTTRDLNLPNASTFESLLDHAPWQDDRPADPEADISIQFTSGTTSRPKAVVWTHANVLFAAQQTVRNYGLRETDICQIFLPLFHVYALSASLMGTLWAGGAIVLQRKFSARNFWGPAVTYRSTWAAMVPFCSTALEKHDVPDHHFRFWQNVVLPAISTRFGVKTLAQWGMTEMGWLPIMTDWCHTGDTMNMGRPTPGIQLSIRRADGSECSLGETGDLYVKAIPGISMFRTYLKDEQAFANSFDAEGWFDTGDQVRIAESGDLFFTDRVKDIIRVGAENVSATELETVILETGWIEECAVVAAPHPMLDEVPVAFVLPKNSAPKELIEKLLDHCSQNLADFKMIREVHIVDKFPRSTIEKIAKNELRARLVKEAS